MRSPSSIVPGLAHGPVQATEPASARAALPAPGLWLPALSLWRREMVRFVRQPNRVIGALGTPLVFWVLLGSGLSRSFVQAGAPGAGGSAGAAGASYLQYFFPGTVVLILLFTAIFSTISVIEDRREGFLQAVLVAPIPRLALVLGKVLGGASLATAQGVLMLLLWPVVGPRLGWAAEAWALAAGAGLIVVLSIGLTALGLCIAWPMDSTAGFHAIMNLFLMPMWFLSGAVFPVSGAPRWLQAIMYANPLTYGQAAFAAALTGRPASSAPLLRPEVAVPVTLAFTVGIVLLAAAVVARRRRDGMA